VARFDPVRRGGASGGVVLPDPAAVLVALRKFVAQGPGSRVGIAAYRVPRPPGAIESSGTAPAYPSGGVSARRSSRGRAGSEVAGHHQALGRGRLRVGVEPEVDDGEEAGQEDHVTRLDQPSDRAATRCLLA